MKWIIPLILIGLVAVNVQALCVDRIYQVSLVYENGDIFVKSIEPIIGCYPKEGALEGYKYQIVSDLDENLYDLTFGDPGKIYVDNAVDEMTGYVLTPEVSEFTLIIPYIETSETIEIYNTENEKIAEATLPVFDSVVFSPGQNIRISILPTSNGFYHEGFVYFGNEFKGKITINCNYMCLQDKAVSYQIPESWDSGEYSLFFYDYNKDVWRVTKFVVSDISYNTELVVNFR